jgi:hypothetical protein
MIEKWKGLHGDGVDKRGNSHIYSEKGEHIAVIIKGKNSLKNSNRVAAIPEMEDALISFCKWWAHHEMIHDVPIPIHQKIFRAAEKATGKKWEQIIND